MSMKSIPAGFLGRRRLDTVVTASTLRGPEKATDGNREFALAPTEGQNGGAH
jgi:hypothetical protein